MKNKITFFRKIYVIFVYNNIILYTYIDEVILVIAVHTVKIDFSDVG